MLENVYLQVLQNINKTRRQIKNWNNLAGTFCYKYIVQDLILTALTDKLMYPMPKACLNEHVTGILEYFLKSTKVAKTYTKMNK